MNSVRSLIARCEILEAFAGVVACCGGLLHEKMNHATTREELSLPRTITTSQNKTTSKETKLQCL